MSKNSRKEADEFNYFIMLMDICCRCLEKHELIPLNLRLKLQEMSEIAVRKVVICFSDTVLSRY